MFSGTAGKLLNEARLRKRGWTERQKEFVYAQILCIQQPGDVPFGLSNDRFNIKYIFLERLAEVEERDHH